MSENKIYPFYIDPSFLDIEGLDENIFWLVMKIAKRMNTDSREAYPSIKTICADTKWGKSKVIEVTKKAVDLGIVKKDVRYSDKGDLTSNNYTVTTKKIGFIKFEGLNYTFNLDDRGGLSENQTTCTDSTSHENIPQDMGEGVVRKSDNGLSENQTVTNNPILTVVVDKKVPAEEFEIFDLDENRKNLFLAQGYTQELYQLHLLNWRDYIRGLQTKPQNLTSSLSSYLTNHLKEVLQTLAVIRNSQTAEKLSNERMQEFHEAKVEKIKSIGETEKPKIKPAEANYSPIQRRQTVIISQYPGESVEDFEGRVEDREAQSKEWGDNKIYEKKYTSQPKQGGFEALRSTLKIKTVA